MYFEAVSYIKRLIVVIYFICVSALLSGCIALVDDLFGQIEKLEAILGESEMNVTELAQQEEQLIYNEVSQHTEYSEYAITPYFSEQVLCYTGEVHHAEDNICMIPVTCETTETCVAWGNQLIRELKSQYSGFEHFYGFLNYSEEDIESDKPKEIIATFKIENNELVIPDSDENASYYEWFWDEFTWIIPTEELWMLDSFTLFEDQELVSYVVQEDYSKERWNLAINTNTSISYQDSISTHVHEFAHLLFLNAKQIDPYSTSFLCLSGVYIDLEGCAYKNSYVYDFVEVFGSDYDGEFNEYSYVSDYAATNLLEDMAESFYMFVLTETPVGSTVADQKILFFYEYEELVQLRTTILSRVATYMYRVLG